MLHSRLWFIAVLLAALLYPPIAQPASNSVGEGFVRVILELRDPPAGSQENINQQRRSSSSFIQRKAEIAEAQRRLINHLHDEAVVLYQTQILFNGIAMEVPESTLPSIAQLPEVQAIHPLRPVQRATSDAIPHIGAPQAWETLVGTTPLTGEGITIAIIDSGIDYTHAAFGGPGTSGAYLTNDPTIIEPGSFPTAKVIGGYDLVGDQYDPTSDDAILRVPQPDPDPLDCDRSTISHGTHVANIAAGNGVFQGGTPFTGSYTITATQSLALMPGVAPRATLTAYRIFGCESPWTDMLDLALERAIDPNQDGDVSDRPDVISLSLGSSFGREDDSTIDILNTITRLGTTVVVGAGNSGAIPYAVASPATATSVIAVAATDDLDALAALTSQGPRGGDSLLKPDIAAPGIDIRSADAGTGTGTSTYSGTSFSTPFVAGAAALMHQAHPRWSAAEIKAALMNTTAPIMEASQLTSPTRTGTGRLAIDQAVATEVLAYDTERPEAVHLSFGVHFITTTTTITRALTVENTGQQPVTYTLDYTPAVASPGITVTLGVTQTTIAPQSVATLPVTVTLDPAQMEPRSARTDTGYLPEFSGFVVGTPMGNVVSSPRFRVAVHGIPHLATAMTVLDTAITVPTATLTMSETHPSTLVPLVSVSELLVDSPPTTSASWAQMADLEYVGITHQQGQLFVVLTTYGAHDTPHPGAVQYEVYIDTNRSGIDATGTGAEYRLVNGEQGNAFVSVLTDLRTDTRRIQGPLDGIVPVEGSSRVYHMRGVVLPLNLGDLTPVSTAQPLTFRVVTWTWSSTGDRTQVDDSGAFTYTRTPGFQRTDTPVSAPFIAAPSGTVIPLSINLAAWRRNGSRDLLIFHHHNAPEQQVQRIKVSVYTQALPLIQR